MWFLATFRFPARSWPEPPMTAMILVALALALALALPALLLPGAAPVALAVDPAPAPVPAPAPIPVAGPTAAPTIGDAIDAVEAALKAQADAEAAANAANAALKVAADALNERAAVLSSGLKAIGRPVFKQAADDPNSVAVYVHDETSGFLKTMPLPPTTPIPAVV
jgi:hypothetical protein